MRNKLCRCSTHVLQCDSVDMLTRLLQAGVTCARVNLSWGTKEYHARRRGSAAGGEQGSVAGGNLSVTQECHAQGLLLGGGMALLNVALGTVQSQPPCVCHPCNPLCSLANLAEAMKRTRRLCRWAKLRHTAGPWPTALRHGSGKVPARKCPHTLCLNPMPPPLGPPACCSVQRVCGHVRP